LKPTFNRKNACPSNRGKPACPQSQNQTGRGTEKPGNTVRAAKIHRGEIDDLTNKIKETEKKLYGGKIFQTPKELGSLQQENGRTEEKAFRFFDDKSLGADGQTGSAPQSDWTPVKM